MVPYSLQRSGRYGAVSESPLKRVSPVILTAQEEFGLRCALTLARAGLDDEGVPAPLTLGQIAETEGLTTAYAGKIMRLLVSGGVVESTRGRAGGYRLSRPAAEIGVASVLHDLGGKFYDGEICTRTTAGNGLCVHNNDCAIRSLWSGLQSMVDEVLTRTTLMDLASDDEASMEQAVREERERLETRQV